MVQVFKFGGASLKDSAGFIKVADIIAANAGKEIVVVASAIGKTTNALEDILKAYYHRRGNAANLLEQLKSQHYQIVEELFGAEADKVIDELNNTFVEIEWILEDEPHDQYDYLYDQIVSIGEMVATRMLSAYLKHKGIEAEWMDVRDCIRTDTTFREGKVDWLLTEKNIQQKVLPLLTSRFIITQGFIGGSSENFTTTLGREGSDYTAAIFGYALDAESVTIWKDVAGVLNADPRYFPDALKIECLTYHEAIEMTYYGASVIHPKTIKPMQNKKIPLFVRCFDKPDEPGTIISDDVGTPNYRPVFVLKVNQILISVYSKDFSFIAEDNLSHIFSILSRHSMRVSMMQNSAMSFSVCIDQSEKVSAVYDDLKENFLVLINDKLELLTIRNYTDEAIQKYTAGKEILLEQKSRNTIQIVMKTPPQD